MPFKSKTFSNGFIFTLLPILDDLEPEVSGVYKELHLLDYPFTESDVVTTWVMYQLERHAHLTLEFNAQKEAAQLITSLTDKRFFDSQIAARDQLLSQVLPALTCRESIPYTERICRVWTRLPDLHLQFL